MPQHDLSKEYEAFTLGLLSKMDLHGWSLVGVFPTEDDTGECFSYTVGLTTFGHPELIVYGMRPELAGPLLNSIGKQIKAGKSVSAGQTLYGHLGDLPVSALALHNTYDLIYVRKLYGTSDGALQIVWPDLAGRMPWDEGYEIPSEVQPLRGEYGSDDCEICRSRRDALEPGLFE